MLQCHRCGIVVNRRLNNWNNLKVTGRTYLLKKFESSTLWVLVDSQTLELSTMFDRNELYQEIDGFLKCRACGRRQPERAEGLVTRMFGMSNPSAQFLTCTADDGIQLVYLLLSSPCSSVPGQTYARLGIQIFINSAYLLRLQPIRKFWLWKPIRRLDFTAYIPANTLYLSSCSTNSSSYLQQRPRMQVVAAVDECYFALVRGSLHQAISDHNSMPSCMDDVMSDMTDSVISANHLYIFTVPERLTTQKMNTHGYMDPDGSEPSLTVQSNISYHSCIYHFQQKWTMSEH